MQQKKADAPRRLLSANSEGLLGARPALGCDGGRGDRLFGRIVDEHHRPDDCSGDEPDHEEVLKGCGATLLVCHLAAGDEILKPDERLEHSSNAPPPPPGGFFCSRVATEQGWWMHHACSVAKTLLSKVHQNYKFWIPYNNTKPYKSIYR